MKALIAVPFLVVSCIAGDLSATATLSLPDFKPLPAADAAFSAQLEEIVKKVHLDNTITADKNPDKEDECCSICVVDISDSRKPRVGGWKMENFLYPASTYKMYVLGEGVRQVCAGERSLDDITTVSENNYRGDDYLKAGESATLSEILRQVAMYSNNTAANVMIDLVDRRRATAMLHALGCKGSDVTRKFVPRTREDAEFTSAPGTVTSGLHLATFLWAVENGVLGGGRGRGLIKGYLGMNVQNKNRLRAGLPPSATIYSKTGEWDTFTAEAGIVEDGPVRYIICVLTCFQERIAAPRIAEFGKEVHALLARPPSTL